MEEARRRMVVGPDSQCANRRRWRFGSRRLFRLSDKREGRSGDSDVATGGTIQIGSSRGWPVSLRSLARLVRETMLPKITVQPEGDL